MCRHRHRHRDHHHRPHSRILVGAIIIVIGIVALLGNLGIIDARNVVQFWPTIFIILGAVKLSHTRHAGGYLVGGVFVGAGALMMLNNAGIVTIHLRDWWPVLLIAGGAAILFKGARRGRHGAPGNAGASGMPQLEQVMHSDILNTTAVMSGANIKSDTQDFKGGELTAVMGGIDLDLRQASIQNEAVLRVFALWGGISIKVPADWSIAVKGVPILGGIDDKTVPPMNPVKRLIIDGEVIMGGVEIKN